MTGAGDLIAVAALACVAGAAIADLRHFEIPDGWSIAVAALFIASAVIAPSPEPWWAHAAAGATVFAAGALLFSRGWLGGGDVKLLAACAVWSGFAGLPSLLLGTAFAGGMLALVAVIGRRLARDATYPGLRRGGPLPYAVAILGGAALLATALPTGARQAIVRYSAPTPKTAPS